MYKSTFYKELTTGLGLIFSLLNTSELGEKNPKKISDLYISFENKDLFEIAQP